MKLEDEYLAKSILTIGVYMQLYVHIYRNMRVYQGGMTLM